MVTVIRSAAFTSDPAGGNPAGVVLHAEGLDDAAMQRIAAEVDYAETAFVTGVGESNPSIRYFSPIAEVPFCGHATIATAVALIEHDHVQVGELTFRTPVGPIVIRTARSDGAVSASFTSVEPVVEPMGDETLAQLTDLIGVSAGDVSQVMPPALVFAGNIHPLLALSDRTVFDSFAFDPVAARSLMDRNGWPATIVIIHGTVDGGITARNIFPVGRITEDPATGSAAAAIGAYVRAHGLVSPPASFVIHQGEHVGRPSLLTVEIPESGGITVSGTAVEITNASEH
ncbi:PhzF family phenazine biosynthesis protein [Microbacterium sp. LTA6]|uniref:PhzF family phenazine biosynthesis protein n=1 Tax=Microbacterium sp. LTA6 TaxID=3129771 RepID=UPI00324888F5